MYATAEALCLEGWNSSLFPVLLFHGGCLNVDFGFRDAMAQTCVSAEGRIGVKRICASPTEQGLLVKMRP